MNITFGQPGPDGSLGQCAYCGNPFTTEILLGRAVQSLKLLHCDQIFFVHHECTPKLEACKEFEDLPKESPLRQAWQKYYNESLCSECGKNPADYPGTLCVGCSAYKEHTAT